MVMQICILLPFLKRTSRFETQLPVLANNPYSCGVSRPPLDICPFLNLPTRYSAGCEDQSTGMVIALMIIDAVSLSHSLIPLYPKSWTVIFTANQTKHSPEWNVLPSSPLQHVLVAFICFGFDSSWLVCTH
ncbi:hypothetical protein MAP00_005891 [Monascus purpureus]|nr:hypothetical protein MAP00_005891 [Monascus purpureus]